MCESTLGADTQRLRLTAWVPGGAAVQADCFRHESAGARGSAARRIVAWPPTTCRDESLEPCAEAAA
jgi:hypothetical protein